MYFYFLGGHTAEMLRLTGALNLKVYNPRHYVIANTDSMSLIKLKELESDLSQVKVFCNPPNFIFILLPLSVCFNIILLGGLVTPRLMCPTSVCPSTFSFPDSNSKTVCPIKFKLDREIDHHHS